MPNLRRGGKSKHRRHQPKPKPQAAAAAPQAAAIPIHSAIKSAPPQSQAAAPIAQRDEGRATMADFLNRLNTAMASVVENAVNQAVATFAQQILDALYEEMPKMLAQAIALQASPAEMARLLQERMNQFRQDLIITPPGAAPLSASADQHGDDAAAYKAAGGIKPSLTRLRDLAGYQPGGAASSSPGDPQPLGVNWCLSHREALRGQGGDPETALPVLIRAYIEMEGGLTRMQEHQPLCCHISGEALAEVIYESIRRTSASPEAASADQSEP
jgi:hypothetical protein